MKNTLLRAALIAICLGLILWGVVAAVDFRKNLPEFVPTDEAMKDYRAFQAMPMTMGKEEGDHEMYPVPLPSADEIVKASEIIVEVTPTGRREWMSFNVLSEVTVEKVLKSGRDVAAGDTLLLYEPVHISPVVGNEYVSGLFVYITGNNNIMQSGRSYIACLNFYEHPEGYKYSEDELRIYVFANQHFGMFPVERPDGYALIPPAGEGEEVTYSEIRPYDVVAGSEKEFKDYLDLWDRINELINKADNYTG